MVFCDPENIVTCNIVKRKKCMPPYVRAATTWQRLTSTCCFRQEPTDSRGLVNSLRVKLRLE